MTAKAATVLEFRSRDADRTQQEILRAAMSEFADHGFGGARIDAIAERAGVNKKLIYYYFEGKDELFLAVLEKTYAHIRAAQHALHPESAPPPAAMECLVRFTWRHYLAHPEFLALLNSENMLRAGHLKRSRRIRQMNSPLIDVLAEVLARGEQSVELRPGVDPMQLYISIAGLAYFYLGNNYTLSAIFGHDLKAAEAKAERLAHMTDMELGFLAPGGACAGAVAGVVAMTSTRGPH